MSSCRVNLAETKSEVVDDDKEPQAKGVVKGRVKRRNEGQNDDLRFMITNLGYQ